MLMKPFLEFVQLIVFYEIVLCMGKGPCNARYANIHYMPEKGGGEIAKNSAESSLLEVYK